jgi:hypothetical protein
VRKKLNDDEENKNKKYRIKAKNEIANIVKESDIFDKEKDNKDII